MRKLALFLCFALVFLLIGCTDAHHFDTPVTFFYTVKTIDHENGGSVFGKETRESAPFAEDIQLLINEYLKGPKSDNLYNPFPEGSSITGAKRDGNVLTLYLSKQFDKLSLDKLSIAISCLAQTAFEYTSAPVLLLIPDGTFIDGSTNKTLTADSFMFSDKNTSYEPPK